MSDLLPAVLLNALRQYKFDGSPIWRMADGKDHVKIEVTFRKPTNQRFDKKGAESRRRPTLPAGEWTRQPAPARHPATRPTPPASQQPTTPEKEQHHQHSRHYRSTQLPSQCRDQRRQHRSRLHLQCRDQLHRLLLRKHRLQRNREPSHQRLQDSRRNTSMST